jgi:hypothetical protein
MLLLIIILIVFFGGGLGYIGQTRGWPGGGPGISLGTVLLILLICWALGLLPR